MKNEEKNEENKKVLKRVYTDLFQMLETWRKDDIPTNIMVHAGLSIFLQVAFDLAPSKHAVLRMLSETMAIASEGAKEWEEHNNG